MNENDISKIPCVRCIIEAVVSPYTKFVTKEIDTDEITVHDAYANPQHVGKILVTAHALEKRVEINSYIVGPSITIYKGSILCAVHLISEMEKEKYEQKRPK